MAGIKGGRKEGKEWEGEEVGGRGVGGGWEDRGVEVWREGMEWGEE